jgi:hypothetical protein
LARLEKEQGNAKASLAAAQRALELAPDLAEARCLRGWGKAGTGKYAEALTDLGGCRGGDPAFAVAELQSRVALQQWSEAAALLASFTAAQRKLPGVADLEKKVDAGTRQAATPSTNPVVGAEAQRTSAPAANRSHGTARPAPPAPESTAAGGGAGTQRATAAPAPRPQPSPTPPRDAADAAAPPGDAAAPATPPRSAAVAPTPAPVATPAAAAPTPAPVATAAAAARTPAPVAGTSAAAPAPTPVPASAAPARASSSPPGPVGGALAQADETTLARAQAMLSRARTPAEIEEAYALADGLAARYPDHQRVQHTAAEIAYRASRWSDAVRHFRRGGDPGEAQPLLLFYYAVSLWESGAHSEAAAVMRRCDGKVRPTPFVQAYRDKILGAATAGS